MKVAVSACLLGENCKYSGGNNRCERLLEVLHARPDIEVIPVCPEVAGGLPTPRPPAEIMGGEVVNNLGESVDTAYRAGVAAEMARSRRRSRRGSLRQQFYSPGVPVAAFIKSMMAPSRGRLFRGKACSPKRSRRRACAWWTHPI